MDEYQQFLPLLELVSKQTKKISQLKKQLQEFQDAESSYYNKYQKVREDNLKLQNRVAELEMKLSTANYELEKRNRIALKQGLDAFSN